MDKSQHYATWKKSNPKDYTIWLYLHEILKRKDWVLKTKQQINKQKVVWMAGRKKTFKD
jgi:hypothetical protein